MEGRSSLLTAADEAIAAIGEWALAQSDSRGGAAWPAVLQSDELGVWTTSQYLRMLLKAGCIDADRALVVADFLAGRQSSRTGWPLISGDSTSTIATAEVCRSLRRLIVQFPSASHDALEEAVLDAAAWLIQHQSRGDGGRRRRPRAPCARSGIERPSRRSSFGAREQSSPTSSIG